MLCWSVSAGLFAGQITGTVTNGTTNKPAAGNEVVLLALEGGMSELTRATTDGKGRYTIDVPDTGSPHLLRVNHQGVNYFHNAPPGTTTADITVYNAAKQVESIFEDARVYRMQAERGELEVATTYTLRNESQPPRTKMDNETFEVELPQGAQLVEGTAAGPSGMPLSASPVPTGKNNRYAMVFPIRPGQTKFHVLYKMPYSGSYEFSFAPDSQLSELGVLLPKSMQFTGTSRSFARDTDEAGLAVFFVKNVAAHEQVRFSVSGEGVAPQEGQAGEAAPSAPSGSAPASSGSNALWYLLGVMVVVIAGGGLWLWRRSGAPASARERAGAAKPASGRPGRPAAPASQSASSPVDLLEALKDELFQLERDRLDGKLSAEDYAKSKAGLDALLRRQLKKNKS
jgi:hypothetical protein